MRKRLLEVSRTTGTGSGKEQSTTVTSEGQGIKSWNLRSKAARSSLGQLSEASIIVCSWLWGPSTAWVCICRQMCLKSQINIVEDTRFHKREETSFLSLVVGAVSLLPPLASITQTHSLLPASSAGSSPQAMYRHLHL